MILFEEHKLVVYHGQTLIDNISCNKLRLYCPYSSIIITSNTLIVPLLPLNLQLHLQSMQMFDISIPSNIRTL